MMGAYSMYGYLIENIVSDYYHALMVEEVKLNNVINAMMEKLKLVSKDLYDMNSKVENN